MATWRYIAQRATTGDFLEFEVPFLERSELSWAMSAAGYLKGSIPAASGLAIAPDGRPLLEEWNTLLYAEADGEIRWGGIVITSEANGDTWDVEAATFATYPNDMPFLGEYRGVQVDPADIVRAVWADLQGYARGDLGVTVTGSTPIRLGSTSEAKYNDALAAYNAAQATYESERDSYTNLRNIATNRAKTRTTASAAKSQASKNLTAAKKTKNPATIAAAQAAYNQAVADYNAAVAAYNAYDAAADAQAKVRDSAKAAADKAKDARDAAKKVMDADGGAYKLLWWEAPDAGKAISDLAAQTPFDYTETHAWNAGKTAITHQVNVQYPRAGRRRTDLAFIQGDNLTSAPVPKSNGDSYANTVFALGAGEGRAIKHTTTAVNDGRLRRVNVLSSKDTKTVASLQAQARNELNQSLAALTIDQINVRDHPNAPIGSWALGDDILVQADVPFLGRIAIWHRITAWSLTGDSTATIKLARSDSFTYGK